ncbi:MAG: ABC transporter substrate-binding protein [Desulfomicrobium apsheronum]|nr:ABC transporter substrate-binding protein [Desulfomicrobium apsheronum]
MRIFVLLAASLLFAQTAFAEPVGSPIPVGIAVGQTTNVALFGEEQVNGAKVAERMINEKGGVGGTPIKLVFQDTGGDEAGAINAFQNLISRDKVVAIIGPTLSQQAFAANPIANQAKVPVVGPSNTAKGVAQIGEYVSRISAPMTLVAPNALKRALAVNPNIKNVAVVYAQDDAFNVSETGIFQEAIKGMGLSIVLVQKTSVKDTDFTTQVTAILGAGVDMVVMSCLAADGGNMVKQLRQFGYEGLIVGGNGFNSPNMYPVCGKECTGVIVAQAYSPRADNAENNAFVPVFKEMFKKDPAQFSAQAYTSVKVVVDALNEVEQSTGKKVADMDTAELRTALNAAIISSSYETPLGEIVLDADGEITQKTFYVSQIKIAEDGKTGIMELLPE